MNTQTQAFSDALLCAVVDEMNRHKLRRLDLFIESRGIESDPDGGWLDALSKYEESGSEADAIDEFFGAGEYDAVGCGYDKTVERFLENNSDLAGEIGEQGVDDAIKHMESKLESAEYMYILRNARMNTMLDNEEWPDAVVPNATESAPLAIQ